MSLAELFPNAGSYTGSTRNLLTNKTNSTPANYQDDNNTTALPTTSLNKLNPINVAKNLVTDEILSQIFTSQQDINDKLDCVKSNLAHSATNAYTEIANKEKPQAITNLFFAT